jgi:DNA-binding NarL/FixJ family response regulator
METIRVALIEDHDLTRFGIRAGLQSHPDIELVGEARDGQSGLKLLASTHPDVAIVDIGLPDMTGIELTQQVKANQTDADAPQTAVLIMTMHDDEASVLAAFTAGADSYCTKTLSMADLADAVRVTAEGHAWIDPAIAKIVLKQVQTPHPAPLAAEMIPIQRLPSEEQQGLQMYPLTHRELEVLQLIVDGYSNAQIAEKLYITVGTVKTHVRNILNKLAADDRTQVAVRALRAGLVK